MTVVVVVVVVIIINLNASQVDVGKTATNYIQK